MQKYIHHKQINLKKTNWEKIFATHIEKISIKSIRKRSKS